MNTKSILLAYATRFGSTQEVAETVASVLREAGIKVELQPMQEVRSLFGYDAVVMGAALYNTRWHQDAHQFLEKHQDALQQRLLAIFALGPVNSGEAAMRNSRRQLDKDLEKYPWLKPVALEMFAGKYDPAKLSFFYKFMPARDLRDWEAIRTWASELAVQLEYEKTLQPAHGSK
jgi:menaquinone-dependent protoporphyrinogen oxidase